MPLIRLLAIAFVLVSGCATERASQRITPRSLSLENLSRRRRVRRNQAAIRQSD